MRHAITQGVYPALKRVRWIYGNSPWFGDKVPVLTENLFQAKFGQVDVEFVIEGMGPKVVKSWVGQR